MSSALSKLKKKAVQPAGRESKLAQAARRDEAALKKQRCTAANLLKIATPKMKKEIIQEFAGYLTYWLHAYMKFGKKRIRAAIKSFVTLNADLQRDDTTMTQVAAILQEECGIDIYAMNKEIMQEVEAEQAELKESIKRNKHARALL